MWRAYLSILTKNRLPEVVDLFSGCGGLALGFQQAGYNITHGIELMENATQNVNYNLDIRYGRQPSHICADITKTDVQKIKSELCSDNGCIVIGGPPCQAYSLIGRAKLNSLREEGTFLDDKRGFLFEDFLRFATGLNARAVVMENVRTCTAYGKINVPERVAEILEPRGYTVYWTILNSADFGVPQIRERMILFAIKGKVEPVLPTPTHSGKKFDGLYAGQGLKDLLECPHYIPAKQRTWSEPGWVTVEEAIGDLPSLRCRPNEPYVANSMQLCLPYETEPENEYQAAMRGDLDSVSGNVYHNTVRDYPIFAGMKEGDNYVQALAIARQLLKDKAEALDVSEGTLEYAQLEKETVPPYSEDKFLSKWKKIDRDRPCHTLVAHLSIDSYSHIHPWEPRGISVREAARIQSFPDDYVFQSNMGDAFKQIGNSVPPLMAKAIAKVLKEVLAQQEVGQDDG